MEENKEKNDKREHTYRQKKMSVRANLSITCFAATLESVHQLTSSSHHSHSNSLTAAGLTQCPSRLCVLKSGKESTMSLISTGTGLCYYENCLIKLMFLMYI